MNRFLFHQAINYSGYRDGQSPLTKTYPSKAEILEDLRLLEGEFYYLRLYDCSTHMYRVLELITEHKLPFRVMLGLSLMAEENHENHPFHYKHPDDRLLENKTINEQLIQEIIDVANRYRPIVSAISVGNEVRSIWSNRRVSVNRLISTVQRIQRDTDLPVTYCEEFHVWLEDLSPLAKVVDFISLHTYPAWQGSPIEDALGVAIRDFQRVQDEYPDKYCIITETGWPTSSHGARINPAWTTAENQRRYNAEITQWGKENNTLVYVFEAFDEPWKGGNHPAEPEKHWGIYYVDRTRK